MAKQNFLGLVKFTGASSEYEKQKALGKLIFAQITSPDASAGKYIYANGIEYKVADSTNLDELIERVNNLNLSVADISLWKREVEGWIPKVDTSIAALETSTNTLEIWRKHIDDVSVDAIKASVSDLSTRMEAVEAFDSRIDSLETSMGISESSINKLETSVGGLLKSATLSATATGNIATVQVDTLTDAGTPATSSVTVTGDAYVAVGQSANNALTLTTKLGDIATATADASGLATAYDVSAFVKSQLGALSNALVFKNGVDGEKVKLPTTGQKTGDTYVATAPFVDGSVKADNGDLIIWNGTSWIVVERNLDGAVTSGDTLTEGYMVQGAGNQAIATSTVSLQSIVEVSTNAVRTIVAHSSTGDFLEAQAFKTGTTYDISYGVKTHDVSTATSDANGLATAFGVKEYVDAKATEVKVSATLNSSTPNYVDASASVDEAGRVITASVGVKTATLADASNGIDGLATAMDVYKELTAVEETMATANTTMANTIGLNSDYSVTWTDGLGISADASIVKAIEEVAKKADDAKQSGVTEFGGATGKISVDTTNATDGSIAFTMDDVEEYSASRGFGWSGLVNRVAAAETSIGNVSNRVNEVSTRLDDLSTYVHTTVDASIDALQAKDEEIDASIDRLDASVSALETELAKHTVKSIEGETGISERANDEYVAVSVTKDDEGKVTLDSSVQLAENVDLASITGATAAKATGLATDATVKDYVTYALAWDVIGD